MVTQTRLMKKNVKYSDLVSVTIFVVSAVMNSRRCTPMGSENEMVRLVFRTIHVLYMCGI